MRQRPRGNPGLTKNKSYEGKGENMKRPNFKVAVAAFLAFCLVIVSVPKIILAEENSLPSRGNAPNAAEALTVLNNDAATQIYQQTKTVNVAKNTRGKFSNMYFYGDGTECTYYYAADINIADDTSNYGSVRLTLGSGTYNGRTVYIEVCYRPGINQSVAFLNGGGETPLQVSGGQGLQYGTVYHCVAVYDKGAISFYANGIKLINSARLPDDMTDIVLDTGYYSQNSNGTISNIEIWGDAESLACPQIGNSNNEIFKVAVKDPAAGAYKKLSDGFLGYTGVDTNRTEFFGVTYGEDYYLSAEAVFCDNKNSNGSNEVDWEGLIFKTAVAESDGEQYDIELRVRKTKIAFFAVNSKGEKVIDVVYGHSFPYGEAHDFTVAFHRNSTVSFWADGENLYNHFDLSKFGYTVKSPCVSIGGEVCTYRYEDIKLWGDISASAGEEYNTELSDTEYSCSYDLTLPPRKDTNKNFFDDAKAYSDSAAAGFSSGILTADTENSAANVNFYLDYKSLRMIKKANKTSELGTLAFAKENSGTATGFLPGEEVVYSLCYNVQSGDSGSFSLFLRYFGGSGQTLSVTLYNSSVELECLGEKMSGEYPGGASFFGKHSLSVKMNGEYAVVFIDGEVCLKTCYNEYSVPMFSVSAEKTVISFDIFSAYRTNSADPDDGGERYETGDVNTDDSIDIKDIVRLKKVLAGSAEITDSTAGDINSDGAYNSEDAASLRKVLLNGGLGLGGNIEVFHDQSDFYMSSIQPKFDEDVELKIRAKVNTVTDAVIQYSLNGTDWSETPMRFSGSDKSGYYQYFSGTVPGQKSGFYYRFAVKNCITGEEQTLKYTYRKPGGGAINGWYCMAGQITPDWAKGALWYSLVPDAFYNGDLLNDKINSGSNTVNSWNNVHTGLSDRYGGDLSGVEQKLGYIKSLGADAIYMNPISKSYQNCGYGTIDYNQIEPSFGNAAVLKSLTDSMRSQNLRMMTDVVLYFSPNGSKYLNQYGYNPLDGAFQSEDSYYTQMFKFTNWPEYEKTEWGGLYTNLFNSALQELLYKASNSALQRLVGNYGIDGLRFDCGGYLGSKTDSELRNSLIKDMRSYLKSANPDMLMLSEYDYNCMTGYSWDSQWNLDLRSAFDVFVTGELISGQTYSQNVSSVYDVLRRSLYNLPRQQALTIQNIISFHDDNRVNTDSAAGRAATLMQMTYIGSPVIYYGQEIGLNRGLETGISQLHHAGASFYAMDWNEENRNHDMLRFYKSLGEIRKNYSAVKTGAVEDIECNNSLELLAFARYDENGAVITLANSGEKIEGYAFDAAKFGIKDGTAVTDYFSGEVYTVRHGMLSVNIPSGGTLLVTGIPGSNYREKSAVLYSGGAVTAQFSGNGAYSLTAIDGEEENAPFYSVTLNGEKAYVTARRSTGSEIIKQAEFTLENIAAVKINRSFDNVFSVSIISGDTERLLENSSLAISMNRTLTVKAKGISGAAVPVLIGTVSDGKNYLVDEFDGELLSAMWDKSAKTGILTKDGRLLIKNGGTVSTVPPDDDWTAETKLVSGCGEISAVKDENNRLSLRYTDSLKLIMVTNGTEEVLGEVSCSAENGLYIQLSRIGTDYAAYYSSDGIIWRNIGNAVYYNPSSVRVELSADSEAEFESFMFGNGTSVCTPHTFAGNGFGYTESKTEPTYKIQRGTFEYTDEGIKSCDEAYSLMTVSNIRFTDFYTQVTLKASGTASKAGIVFGLTASDSSDGYSLYRNGNSVILKYGTSTVARSTFTGDRLILRVINDVLSLYGGNTAEFVLSAQLPDYSGGYVGFFSENCIATFANYYIGAVSGNWIAVKGTVSGGTNLIKVSGTGLDYGVASYRGYGFTDGAVKATLSVKERDSSLSGHCGGLLFGAAFGKSPDMNGVSVVLEDGKAAVKYKGVTVDSISYDGESADICVTVSKGNYVIDINNGAGTLRCEAPDCAGGCISVFGINSNTELSGISIY